MGELATVKGARVGKWGGKWVGSCEWDKGWAPRKREAEEKADQGGGKCEV